MSLRRIRIPMRVREAAYSEACRRAAAFYRDRRINDHWEQLFNERYVRLLEEWREADGDPAWLRRRSQAGSPGTSGLRPPRP